MQTLEQLLSALIKDNSIESDTIIVTPRHIAGGALRPGMLKNQRTLFSPEISSINLFVQKSAMGLPGAIRKVSDNIAASIIRDIVESSDTGWSDELKNLLGSRSGATALLDSFNELLEHNITPRELHSRQAAILPVIATLYESFLAFCSQWKIGTLPILLNSLLTAGNEHLKNVLPKHLIFCQFNTTTPLLLDVIHKAAQVTRVDVLLPSDNDHPDLFRNNRDAAKRLTGIPVQTYSPYDDKAAELTQLRLRLFNSRHKESSAIKHVSFHSAPGKFDETEHAIIAIRRLIKAGVSPDRICLTMRNITDYDQFIRTVFEKLHLPYSMRRGIPMLQSPLIKTVSRCMACGRSKQTFSALLSIIDSTFIKLPDKPELKQLICRSNVYEAWLQQWPEALEAITNRKDTVVPDATLNLETFRSFVNDLQHLSEPESSYASMKLFIKKWILLPEDNKALHQHHLKHLIDLIERTAEDSLFLQRMMQNNLPEEPIQLLQDLISESNIPPTVSSQSGVAVANFFDAGYLEYDHCFIIGMDESSVPKSASSRGGVLTDRYREILNHNINDPHRQLPLLGESWRGEAQAFLLAVGSATESLHFYYPGNDNKGHEVLPSPYFTELLELSGHSEVELLPGGDQRPMRFVSPDKYSVERQIIRRAFQKSLAKDNLAGSLHLAMQENEIFARRLSLLTEKASIEDRRFKFLIFSQGPRPLPADAYSGAITHPDLLNSINTEFCDPEYQWSASTLEKTIRSPFVFFMNKLLNARELRLPEREPAPLVLGSFAHKLLFLAISSIQEKYPNPGEEVVSRAINDSTAEALQEFFNVDTIDQLPLPTKLAISRLLLQLNDFAGVEAKATSRPVSLELEFGSHDCILSLDDQSMAFTGRFDRIDELENEEEELEIIDYKTGSGDKYIATKVNVATGTNLQMPMYMLFLANMKQVNVSSLRGAYLSLRDPGKKINYSLKTPNKKNKKNVLEDIFDSSNETGGLLPAIFRARQTILGGMFYPVGKFENRERMVSRWFELPPEMTGGENNG